jgi:hypothetical protein
MFLDYLVSSENLFHFSAFIIYNFLSVKLGKFVCLYAIRILISCLLGTLSSVYSELFQLFLST